MDSLKKFLGRSIWFFLLSFMLLGACGAGIGTSTEKIRVNSDHFDGDRYFNPDLTSDSRKESGWGFWRGLRYWITMVDWPEWPAFVEFPPGPPPAARVPKGTLRITSIGHSTFLIQMDGLNILTDPIWSDRCSPVSWAGPRRHSRPGLALEDLPPIDAVLVSHNHYDHLDLPTLKKLARKNTPGPLRRSVTATWSVSPVSPPWTSSTGGSRPVFLQTSLSPWSRPSTFHHGPCGTGTAPSGEDLSSPGHRETYIFPGIRDTAPISERLPAVSRRSGWPSSRFHLFGRNLRTRLPPVIIFPCTWGRERPFRPTWTWVPKSAWPPISRCSSLERINLTTRWRDWPGP